jgi:A/G-specific adenine glycosylase
VESRLRAWFEAHGRDLPWRKTRDPYAILVSEVMLQQTQVERVVPRYERWLERWPAVTELAVAATAEVIVEWQGLGYNNRALSLHRAARHVADAGWPDDLTTLPGVGPYTAAAVRNFAFGEEVLPRDVNVDRVERRTGHAFTGRDARRRGPRHICRARIPRCTDARWPSSALPRRDAPPEAARLRGRSAAAPEMLSARRDGPRRAVASTPTLSALRATCCRGEDGSPAWPRG